MGYYSNFKLKVNHADAEAIIGDLRAHNERAHNAIDKNGETQEPSSWYEHKEDLVEFSKKYSDVFFEFFREGENGGDDQVIYYIQNGKCQESWVELKFPEFDPDKME